MKIRMSILVAVLFLGYARTHRALPLLNLQATFLICWVLYRRVDRDSSSHWAQVSVLQRAPPWVFDINPDGTLSNMQKFTVWGGDGMSMDELGNVYISNGQGVMAFDPNGNHILRIPTGSGATNNTFAGRNNKILFITGPVDKVTAVKMNVKGAANW